MSQANPTREDFAALLQESFAANDLAEGYVAKGIVTAIEKDVAIVDVGLKVEGRVPLKEFGAKSKDGTLKVGDEVEVYVERIENALGEAVLSREKARREESWAKLEVKFEAGERVEGVIFNQVKGGFTVDLDGAVAFLPRSQVDIRPIRDVTPLMHNPQPFEILKMDRRRDERDMGRVDSPLKPADDAHLLDTSEMSIEAAFFAAKSFIDAALKR